MSEKISEIDALKKIDEALEQLTPEEKQRIFNFLASKHSLTFNTVSKGGGGSAVGNGVVANASGNGQENITDIKQFLAAKKPHGFYEQVTCVGYFLEKTQGVENFNTKDITVANTAARATKIPNPSLYVNHCQNTYGYFSNVGSGKKAMTTRGEALVEALPDRDAVKTALENNPFKKKSGGKKKKAEKK